MHCTPLRIRLTMVSGIAILLAGFTQSPNNESDNSFARFAQAESSAPPQNSSPTPVTEPDRPLTPEEQKAAERRLQFDRILVDAAVLLSEFEDSRRGRSKSPPSMSAFRNLEIQLNAIADADPANEQARDWAKKMQQAQFEILQPSLVVADVAARQLFADKMSEKLNEQGIAVSVLGSGARTVAFVSRQMTKDMGAKLAQSANIYEQARRLQFEKVVFANGRRGWMYDVKTGRYR